MNKYPEEIEEIVRNVELRNVELQLENERLKYDLFYLRRKINCIRYDCAGESYNSMRKDRGNPDD